MASIVTSIKGGSFLIEERAAGEVFTPEDFSAEHRDIARTAAQFFLGEVAPNIDAIQHQEPGVAVAALRKSAALGLTSMAIPEEYGGLELDIISAMVVAEQLAGDGSYAAWHGAHTGIGTLPLVYYGTPAQKAKYLPKLATAELVAAYALTEPHAGSDALAARTRADLSADGTHYILSGQKMWITNGGAADLFTVFAKIGGDQFTAFLVERAFGGVTSGAEEKKMGIKGSSTTAVYFDNVPVPVENVLGEVGRGHIIAFNILNIGRLKLGAFALGGAKQVLADSLRYAKERKAFGHAIADFGAIRHKLAEMAVRLYATESMVWRTVGLIAPEESLKTIEEYAVECSIVKVHASEMLDYVVDEGVQIHGGYGYHQDYAVERAYRDSRINRIFEGTNEINRLLIPGMLFKRASRGQLALVTAAQKVLGEILGAPPAGENADEEMRLVRNARKITLLAMGLAYQKYLMELDKQQEVLMGIADMVMEVFAMESALLRSRKTGTGADLCAVLLRDGMARVEVAARTVLAACSDGDALRTNMAVLRRFAKYEPVDAIALRRRIADRLLAAGRYCC
ncbi:MAG: acyl-CoA dehydrogenase domain protein [Candidatus Solibacter sp.]|nr:acyl-CoA dehydrogenase domain protein [Candidatus Solibacter sp.]